MATALYDKIGIEYSANRRTDPKIARQLSAELLGARRIVNIGAGTGSYEPEGVDLIAVEPSAEMISQRPPGAWPVRQASAEELPFDDDSFTHAMTVLSMHHWQDRPRAFAEIKRVATEKFVAITWDPLSEPFWFTRDYFPEMLEDDLQIFPTMNELREHFGEISIQPLLIPGDCQDGFLAAYWKRPAAYLDKSVQQSISSFAKLNNLDEGIRRLEADIKSGAWAKSNEELLGRESLDAGYRLVTASLA